MLYSSSPIEALQRASEVLSDYWELVTKSDVPLDWRCQHEYTESFGSTTELSTEPSTQYFTGERLYLLENSLMDRKISSEFSDVQIKETKSNFFLPNRKLWEKISKDIPQKPCQRLVPARLYHRLRLWRTSVHSHSLLPHHTKGTRASSPLSPRSDVFL